MRKKGKQNKGGKAVAKPRASQKPCPVKAHCPVVAIGASAGGLEVFQQFFDGMPANSGMVFILIQHLDPNHETLMPELLAKHTGMKVLKAEDGQLVEANHVYVIPPNSILSMEKCTLRLTPQKKLGDRAPINHFFRSLAEDQEENVVAIVLSGIGSDGSIGLKSVKEHGGLTMAQSVETAKYDSMPRSAISTGLVDYILPVAQMPAKVVEYIKHLTLLQQRKGAHSVQQQAAKYLPKIVNLLRRKTSHDFGSYKQSTLLRRIQRRMQLLYFNSVSKYVELLHEDAKEAENLFKDLLIGVTQFFRDGEAFEALAKQVISKIRSKKSGDNEVRIWVPGCASGEEAYSIAILVAEEISRLETKPRVQIFATDLDTDALDFARKAKYPEQIAEQISPQRLKRFFNKQASGYEVSAETREMCIFSPHNLIKDPPFSRLDLISCRNLLIYLEADLQKRLLPLFHYALRPSGVLFLGPSENVANRSEFFHPLDPKNRIFKRKPTVLMSPVDLPILESGRVTRLQPFTAPQFSLPREQNIARTIERVVLEDYSPAAVIINEQGEVMYFTGRTGKFLDQPAGVPSNKIINMARKNLRLELRAAVHRATSTRREVVRENVPVKIGRELQYINLIVRPLTELGKEAEFYIVVFQELVRGSSGGRIREISDDDNPLMQQLESELRTTKEDLQTTIEELETSNEELKSANEELLSMNEELQSTNEELQTSKEELESTNDELKRKVEEVDTVNSDLQNFFQSTQVATVFVDKHLRIKKFTPALTRFFRLTDRDVGRGLLEVLPELGDSHLIRDIREVIHAQVPDGRTVHLANHRWFIMRITPYRSIDHLVQGAVITFTDITEIKQAEEQRAQLAAIVESSEDAIIGKTLDGIIRSWNRAAEKMYGYTAAEVLGRPISLLIPLDRLEEWPRQLEHLKRGEPVSSFETKRIAKNGRILAISLTLSPIYDSKGMIVGVSGIDRDITDKKRIEDALHRNEQLLTDFFENATIGLHWVGPDGKIIRANRAETELLGYSPKEYIGRHISEFHADQHVIDEILNRLTQGQTLDNFEARLRCKDGSIRHVLISSNGFWENGKFVHSRCFTRDVTEQKRAALELRESQTRLNMALDSGQMGTWEWIISSGKITWSPTLEIIHGLAPGTFGGRFEDFQRDIHPEDREKVLAKIQESLEKRTDYRIEYRIIKSDGRISWIETRGKLFLDAEGKPERMAGICTDATRRKQAEEALRHSEERFRRATEAGNVGTWEWDIVDNRIIWSEQTYRLHGLKEKDFSGRMEDFPKLLAPEERERVQAAITSALEGKGNYDLEFRALREPGRFGWFHTRGTVIRDEKGKPLRMIGATVDITERKEGELLIQESREKLARHAEELEHQVSERTAHLKDTVQSLEGVCYTIAHDLRAPLRAVQGFTKILRDEYSPALDEEGREFAGRIVAAAVRMDELIKDLLDYARLSHVELPSTWLDLNQQAQIALEHLADEIKNKNAEITVSPLPQVLANGTVLQQIFTNLIGNALKFVAPQVTPKIEIWAENYEGGAKIFIKDNGIGIDPQHHERIFGLFHRLHEDKVYSGTGVGLAIVKKGMDRVGGKVSVDSSVDHGSCFCLELRSV